jgi:glyoxylase-like metal-dependent hydrolase (beta-lactamase superfamily II)
MDVQTVPMPQIGPYTLYTVETGRFGLDGGAMFGIVPKPLWSSRIEPDAQNRIPLHMRCLLLEGADRLILVDTGIGDAFVNTKYEDIYAVDHEDATLDGSLHAHGFRREDVTDVILTHLHFDHCGGATRGNGETRTPTFPNATYHVQAAHWEWATTSNPKEKGSFLQETFLPIQAAGQLHRVDGPGTLAPGIDLMLANGHTESQQLVKVSDAERTLVYVADLLPTTHHLAAAWTMAYDIRPLVTMDEKADFLQTAVEEDWQLFFEHDPDTAVASLTRTDRRVEVANRRSLDAL